MEARISRSWAAQFSRKPRSPDGLRRLLHFLVLDVEIPVMEVCSAILTSNRELIGLQLDLARQIWDEARHADFFIKRLQQLGRPNARRFYRPGMQRRAPAGTSEISEFVIIRGELT
jgi:hypothetical protein